MSLTQTILRLDGWLVGVAAGVLAPTPAIAARLPLGPDAGLTPRDWLLAGSLVLLAVGVVLRLMERRHASDAKPEAPDLRWWMNP
ncbi:MAG TPA: hypothetical protein VMN56_13260 [Casimicrobiaceae bacterium]|nr:hypothetical protein [Casimicrobiaceae bacterium]